MSLARARARAGACGAELRLRRGTVSLRYCTRLRDCTAVLYCELRELGCRIRIQLYELYNQNGGHRSHRISDTDPYVFYKRTSDAVFGQNRTSDAVFSTNVQ